jgi:hypothetical protein
MSESGLESKPESNPPPPEPRRAVPVEAALLSFSMSGFGSLIGEPALQLRPEPPAPAVRFAEWPWANPLETILRFGGWDLDSVLEDPEAASYFGTLWDAWRELQDRRAEGERAGALRETLWHRRQGCPVPCPLCGEIAACACPTEL